MISLRGYQRELSKDINDAWQGGLDNVLGVLPTGGGKCLGKGTPILMYSGSIKNVEDISVGDFVMGPDSKPRMVSGTCRGRENLYEITPVKGASFVVNESHILSFKQTGSYVIKNVDVLSYLDTSKNWKHTHKAWRTGVSFKEKEYSEMLPPYFLGLWLGDGFSDGAGVTTADAEIVEYLFSFVEQTGQSVSVEDYPNNASSGYHISNKYKRNGTRNQLKTLGLLGDKHIPLKYKTGSDSQRLELLAGVIDSDGHFDGKNIDIVLKSKGLAFDVAYVARSLGFAAYPVECEKTCTNTGVVGTYWRMSISGDFSRIPSKLERNKFKPRRQKKSVLMTGVSVRPLGEGEYFGFSLIGPDKLFLLGDFTVTHNTATFSDIILNRDAPSVAIAHRQELVGQISLALARNGVRHRITGPSKVIKMCVSQHVEKLGRSYFDPNAWHAVAGVDTLIRRHAELGSWTGKVKLWVQDEAHHVLTHNKWGKAVEMFPNAQGLGVTATPTRADGQGLGRNFGGVFDEMIEGPTMRELIDMGYLTDYRISAPPSDFNRPDKVGASGDYTRDGMRKATKESKIVGDVVEHYLRLAPNKLGVTFVPDLETAREVAAQFNASGVPAEVVSSESTDEERINAIRKFEKRQLLQLVNVDLFGEGFDLPAIEVVSFARPTESLSLYIQQFGRVLRLLLDRDVMSGWEQMTPEARKGAIANSTKPFGRIIDHVGNVDRHLLPDARREWTLERRQSRGSGAPKDGIPPMWTCRECLGSWEKIYTSCLDCGTPRPEPTSRSGPEFVDGDLIELDPFVLERMRNEVARVDMHPEAYRVELSAKRVPQIGQLGLVKKHVARQEAQANLRDSLAWWAGHQRALGRPDAESYRRFYFTFGIDVLSAQALGEQDATTLKARIDKHLVGVRT